MNEENSAAKEKPKKKRHSLWWIWFLLILAAFAAGAVLGLKLNTLPIPTEVRDRLYPVLESYIPGSTAVHTPEAVPPAPTPAVTSAPELPATPEPTAEPAPVIAAETPVPEALAIPAPEETPAPVEMETPVPAETQAPAETAEPEHTEDALLEMSSSDRFAAPAEPVRYIGVNAALDAALLEAKVDERDAEITGVVRTKDEDGKAVYEVSFAVGEISYDYIVDAVSGEIDSYQISGLSFSDTATFAASFTGDTMTEAEAAKEPIGEERAKETAYKHASVKPAEVVRVTVDLKEDAEISDSAFYHLEFKTATKSFQYDVDAVSGEILGFEKK